MFGIKRKGREQSAKVHSLIASSILPLVEKLSRKLRYHARKRILNRWGRHHPKRVVGMYGVFVVVIMTVNIMGFFTHNPQSQTDTDPFGMSKMAAVDPVAGMYSLNVNNQAINTLLLDYVDVKSNLVNRLDSLMRLKTKSRGDSIEINIIYSKLTNKTDSNNEP